MVRKTQPKHLDTPLEEQFKNSLEDLKHGRVYRFYPGCFSKNKE